MIKRSVILDADFSFLSFVSYYVLKIKTAFVGHPFLVVKDSSFENCFGVFNDWFGQRRFMVCFGDCNVFWQSELAECFLVQLYAPYLICSLKVSFREIQASHVLRDGWES